jgi:tyrosine-protein kinase Etk/Wzc
MSVCSAKGTVTTHIHMNAPRKTPTNSEVVETFELDMLSLLSILAKWKRPFLSIALGIPLFSFLVTLIVPATYTAATRILPPQQNQSLAASVIGQLGAVAGLSPTSLGLKNPGDLHVGILTGRTISDRIIDRFELKKLYGASTMDKTRRELANRTNIFIGKDGLISIEFDDREPKRAADIANAFVEELEKLLGSLAVTEASQRRLYFEREIGKVKDNLAKAESALRATQEKTGLIKIEEQGAAIIEAVSALRAQIAAKEIEIQAMRLFATEAHPDHIKAKEQLSGLKGQLARLERASTADAGILVPTGKVPEFGLEYIRRLREVKYSEALFEFLAKQLEVAKLDESKELGVVQVVDRAVSPESRSKPRTLMIVLLSAIASAFAAFLCAFVLEGFDRARRDEHSAQKLNYLKATLRRW